MIGLPRYSTSACDGAEYWIVGGDFNTPYSELSKENREQYFEDDFDANSYAYYCTGFRLVAPVSEEFLGFGKE